MGGVSARLVLQHETVKGEAMDTLIKILGVELMVGGILAAVALPVVVGYLLYDLWTSN